jgi:predicted phage terminase large subunit-like protein
MRECAEGGRARAENVILRAYDNLMNDIPSDSVEWAKFLVETTDGKDNGDSEHDEIETQTPSAEPLNAWLKRATPEHDWDAPHLLLLQEKLEAIERGELKRLLVSMPPRHGKSELLSIHAPVWFLERNPKREVIAAGYAVSLARKFSRKARKLAERMGVGLNPKVAQASEWETADGGRMYAVGVGGGIAGHGADVLIVDDPVKNVQEASSPLIREKIWDWFISEAMTRLSPTGAAIVIMTRRHEADLIGSLVEGRDAETGETDDPDADQPEVDVEDENWEYVRIPAISEGEGDPLGRPEGEALWKRWPIEALRKIRKRGEWLFAALYQQRPTPRSGGLFQREWFSKYVDAIPAGGDVRFVRYWDKASSLDKDADFTAGVLMAVRDGVFYVIDVIEKKVTPKGRRDLQRSCAENDPRGTVIWIEHEGGSSGADAAEEEAKALAGFPVHWEHPTGPKWSRAESLASQCEAGNLVIVKGGWNRKFLEQLCQFPNGKHDDMVDAASGACRKLSAKKRIRMV